MGADDDENKDQFIDADEFQVPFSASVWTEAQVASLFQRMDANSDGRISLRPDSTGFFPVEFQLIGADFEEKRVEALREVVMQIGALNPALDQDYDTRLLELQLAKLKLELSPSARFNPLTGLGQIPPLQAASSDQICLGCLPGSYGAVNGSGSCRWCSPGSYSSLRATRCTLCVPGKYSNITGLPHRPSALMQRLVPATTSAILTCPVNRDRTDEHCDGVNGVRQSVAILLQLHSRLLRRGRRGCLHSL